MIGLKSKKQATSDALSYTEAKYKAIAILTSELLWVVTYTILRAFDAIVDSSIVFCDSQSGVRKLKQTYSNIKWTQAPPKIPFQHLISKLGIFKLYTFQLERGDTEYNKFVVFMLLLLYS
jgi:hypothetical protein